MIELKEPLPFLIITGDSHTASLKFARENLINNGISVFNGTEIIPLASGDVMRSSFFDERDDIAYFNREICKSLISQLPLRFNGISYGFCGNLHTTRIMRDIDWVKYAPFEVVRNEIPISLAFLHKIFEFDQKYMIALLNIFLKNHQNIFVIEAPYPFRGSPLFKRVRTEVLQYIDKEYRGYVKKNLMKMGIDVVSIPLECVDQEGFMLDKFLTENGPQDHHCNKDFGEVMMIEIINYLKNASIIAPQ